MARPFLPLFQKFRRDGIVAGARALFERLTEEAWGAAIAGHRAATARLRQSFAGLPDSPQAGKYLSAYLAKGLSRKTRRSILLHHYDYLASHAPADFHAALVRQPCVLWRQPDDAVPLEIILAPNFGSRYEGELSLIFQAMGISIFELSFSIAPGEAVGSACRNVMLVGRVQGGRRFDLIRIATKGCLDISPKQLLMSAAQSVAQSLALEAIIGVGNDRQVGNPDAGDPFYLTDYDAFWDSQMAVKTAAGFYELPLPLPQKPLSDVSATHRRRAKRKRQFRENLGQLVQERFRAFQTQATHG